MGLYLTEKHIKYKNGKEDVVSPIFIYHHNNKRTKVFCSLKIKNSDWCFDSKKVKSSDKDSGKNRHIESIKSQLNTIIDNYDKNEILTEKLRTG